MKNTHLGLKGSLLGLISVISGALASHWMQKRLLPEQLDGFKTAVYFLFFHAILFLIFAQSSSKNYERSLQMIFIGILLFSGSIFIFSFQHAFKIPLIPYSHFVTPIGGIVLISGWFTLVLKSKI